MTTGIRLKSLAAVTMIGASFTLSFVATSQVKAETYEEVESMQESTTNIELVAQLIELSSTTAPTVIVVRTDPAGTFVDYTIDITTLTKFGSHRGNTTSMDDWMSGDILRIIGKKNENTGVIMAEYAINLSLNPSKQHGLNGWITALDTAASTVTVQWNNVEHVIKISSDTRLVIPPNTKATLADFKVGDRVRLRLNGDRRAPSAEFMVALRRGDNIFLKARTRPFLAKVNSIDLNDDGTGSLEVTLGVNPHLRRGDVNNLVGNENETRTVTFDANTKFVRRFNGTTTASDIMVDDQLLIIGRTNDDGTISARLVKDFNIWRKDVEKHQGEVMSIETTTNTIVASLDWFNDEDKEITLTYVDSVDIIKDGEEITEDEIEVGDEIRLRGTARKSEGELVGIEDVTKIWLSAE